MASAPIFAVNYKYRIDFNQRKSGPEVVIVVGQLRALGQPTQAAVGVAVHNPVNVIVWN